MQFFDQIWPTSLISGEDIHSNSIFMINKLDLLWVPNFIALEIYLIFRTKFSWNEGIDTCFNVECVLLGRNFDFLGCYLVVSAPYVVITACYCSLPGGYCSFPLLVWTSCNCISWNTQKEKMSHCMMHQAFRNSEENTKTEMLFISNQYRKWKTQ